MLKVQKKRLFFIILISSLFFAESSFALNGAGAKGVGMSGSRIASVDDSKAYFYNPAAFGFFSYMQEKRKYRLIDTSELEKIENIGKDKKKETYNERYEELNVKKVVGDKDENKNLEVTDTSYVRSEYDNNNLSRKDWGIGFLDFDLKVQVAEGGGKFLDLYDDFKDDFDRKVEKGSAEEVSLIIRMSNAVTKLSNIKDPILFIEGRASVANLRISHFGVSPNISFRGFGKVEQLEFDTSTSSYQQEAKDAIDNYLTANSAQIGSFDRKEGYANVSTDTTKKINDKIESLSTQLGLSTESEKNALAYALNEELKKGSFGESDILNTLDTIDTLTDTITKKNVLSNSAVAASSTSSSTDAAELKKMIKGVFIGKALGIVEIPVSYGHAINEKFSVGGNLKYMIAEEFKYKIEYKDGERVNTDTSKQSTAFGVDLGAMYRMKMLNFGLVGKNLNSPTFTGVDGDEIELEPEVSVGVAFIPFSILTIEADYDLTEQERYGGYKEQFASLGLELDLLRFLALRAGVSKNLSAPEGSNGLTYSAGVGLNLWAIRLDLAASIASDTITYDDDEYPKSIQVALNLEMDF